MQQLILHHPAVHVVDRDTQLADQWLQVEASHRHQFDLGTACTRPQGLSGRLERISLTSQQRAFLRRERNLDQFPRHQRVLLIFIQKRCRGLAGQTLRHCSSVGREPNHRSPRSRCQCLFTRDRSQPWPGPGYWLPRHSFGQLLPVVPGQPVRRGSRHLFAVAQ